MKKCYKIMKGKADETEVRFPFLGTLGKGATPHIYFTGTW